MLIIRILMSAIWEAVIAVFVAAEYLKAKESEKRARALMIILVTAANSFFFYLGEDSSKWIYAFGALIVYSLIAPVIAWLYTGSPLRNTIMFFACRFLTRIVGMTLTYIPVMAINRFDYGAVVEWTGENRPFSADVFFFFSYPVIWGISILLVRLHKRKERKYTKVISVTFFILDFLATVGMGIHAIALTPVMAAILVAISYLAQRTDMKEVKDNFDYYRMLAESTAEQETKLSAIRHDLANHITAIEGLEKEEEAGALLIQIDHMRRKWTRIPVVDCLLSDKKMRAEKKGIALNIDSIAFTADEKEQVNLVSILSNLIDNGVEACERVIAAKNSDSPKCDLEIARKAEYLEICMENDKLPEEKPLEHKFRTTKQDKRHHGRGHKILQRLSEEMEGEIFYEDNGDCFRTKALVKLK